MTYTLVEIWWKPTDGEDCLLPTQFKCAPNTALPLPFGLFVSYTDLDGSQYLFNADNILSIKHSQQSDPVQP